MKAKLRDKGEDLLGYRDRFGWAWAAEHKADGWELSVQVTPFGFPSSKESWVIMSGIPSKTALRRIFRRTLKEFHRVARAGRRWRPKCEV